jgi:hypothetical protein
MINKLTKESWTPESEWGWGKSWCEGWCSNSEWSWGKSRGSNGEWSSNTEWGSTISWGRGSIDWFTRVLDISNVSSGWVRGVGYSLETTVGKVDVVLSLCGITIASFRCTKVGSAEAIGNSIRVVISWGNIGVDWGSNSNWSRSIGWSRGNKSWCSVLGSSCSGSNEGKQSNEALKCFKNIDYLGFNLIGNECILLPSW